MLTLPAWGIRFARPEGAYFVLAVCALVVAGRWLRRRRYCAHSLAGQPVMAHLAPSALRHVPRLIMGTGVVLAGVALMDPRLVARERVTRLEGLDIVLAVDLSLSMKEPLGGLVPQLYGLPPRDPERPRVARMQAMRAALQRFIARRGGDRLGLVVFSENGYVVSPPTIDHRPLAHYVEFLDPAILVGEGRTAIGEGVAAAMGLLEQGASGAQAGETPPQSRSANSRIIVAFTDGENNFGRDPVATLGEARQRGYRVYLVGLDLPQGYYRKESQKKLIEAVTDTGGRYFDANDERQLASANAVIDRIEKGVFVERTVERDVPIYRTFVAAALAALLAGLALSSVPYFIDVA